MCWGPGDLREAEPALNMNARRATLLRLVGVASSRDLLLSLPFSFTVTLAAPTSPGLETDGS